MKYLLLIFTSMLYLNCGSGELEHNTDKKIPSTDSSTIATTKMPSGMTYRGKRVDGYKWEDANGENFIIVSEFKSKNGKEVDMESENWTIDQFPDYSEICLKTYQIAQKGISQIWDICDSCTQPLTLIEYFTPSLEVVDINQDGTFEILYLHHLVPDGVEPSKLFLTIYYKNEKYQLTGTLPIDPKEIDQIAYLKNPSSNFDQLPGNVIDYCHKKWDSFVKEFKDNLANIQ